MASQISSDGRSRDRSQKQIEDLSGFNFNSPAELFPSRSKKGRSLSRYKRFDTAAEAIRFAIEDMTAASLLGAYLEVDEIRLGVEEIRYLYDNAAYPRKRPMA